MLGYSRITKRAFYAVGAFSNPRCARVTRHNRWAYYYQKGN